MRTFVIALLSLSLCANIWLIQGKKQTTAAGQELQDSLRLFKNYITLNNLSWQPAGPAALEAGDEEMCRIKANYGSYVFLIDIHRKQTGAVPYTFHHYSVENPLTKEGSNKELSVYADTFPAAAFDAFKQKVEHITVPELGYDRDVMCCFNELGISLECIDKNGRHYYVSSFCRQCEPLAEAGEALFLQVKNKELLSVIKRHRENL